VKLTLKSETKTVEKAFEKDLKNNNGLKKLLHNKKPKIPKVLFSKY